MNNKNKQKNINIAFLGALSDIELSKEAHEAIGEPDILFVPVGDEDSLSPKEASKLASSLIPKLIIPVL